RLASTPFARCPFVHGKHSFSAALLSVGASRHYARRLGGAHQSRFVPRSHLFEACAILLFPNYLACEASARFAGACVCGRCAGAEQIKMARQRTSVRSIAVWMPVAGHADERHLELRR